MNGPLKFWGGVALTLILVAVFILTVDIHRMVDALVKANYWFLLPGIVLYIIAVLFRTLRWQLLLHHIKPISIWRLFPVVVVGYMANNILPMRLGELVRSYHIGARESISKTSALTSIFIERILDALTLLFFIAISSILIPLGELANAFGEKSGVASWLLVAVFTLPFLITFVLLTICSYSFTSTGRLSFMITKYLPVKFKSTAIKLMENFVQGVIPLRSPKILGLLFLISLPVWLFEVGLFVLVGYSFDLITTYENIGNLIIVMMLVTATANIGSSLPAAPGGIGLFEIVARETLVLLPLAVIDRSVAAGFVTVVHASLLVPMIILGQIFLWKEHLSIRKLVRT